MTDHVRRSRPAWSTAAVRAALIALVGTIVQWRSHWVVIWGVLAIGLSVAGILAALRIAGYWPPG